MTHAIIARRWPVRALMRAAGNPRFATVEWGVIAVDQALHLFILAMLARSSANPATLCMPSMSTRKRGAGGRQGEP
jgi:hypothetical protein